MRLMGFEMLPITGALWVAGTLSIATVEGDAALGDVVQIDGFRRVPVHVAFELSSFR